MSKIDFDGLPHAPQLLDFEGSWGVILGVRGGLGALCLPRALETVSVAVPGGSWPLVAAFLGRLGRQLGAKLAPKKAPEAHKMILKIKCFFNTGWHFCVFHGFWVPTWVHVGTPDGGKSVRN